MDNKKKLIITGAVFVVVLVMSVLVFTGVFGNKGLGSDESTTGDFSADYNEELKSYATVDYKTHITTQGSNDVPYLMTDIENVFYTVSKEGEVKFFTFAEGKFTETEATGTYDVTVKMSEQNLSTTVSYIEKDGVISGYGLYNGNSEEFNLYPYAFFRIADFGSENKKASADYLVLVDTTEADFYSNDKIYDEAFAFKSSDASCTRLVSEANRTVGHDGTKRNDYTLFNDSVIDNATSQHLFFSGRQYAETDERVDLFRSGGTGNNVDNIIIARDVLGYWVKNTEDGLLYISLNENGNVIVAKYDSDDDKSETVKTFDGVTREDIIVDGDYMYIISKNSVYSLTEDKEIALDYDKKDVFKADMFTVLDNTFVVRGYAENRYPLTISAGFKNGVAEYVYADEFFRKVVNPISTDSGVMLTVQNGDKFDYYIF